MSVDDYARLKPRQHGAFDGPASTRRTEEDCSGSQSEQPFAFDEPLKIEKIEITQYEGGLSDVPQINLTAPSPKTQGAGKYENHSLVVRKRLKQDSNRKYQPHETLAEFRDPEIQKALQILLQHFNYHNLASLPIKFKHPYHDLFWIRDELQTYQSSLQRSDKERSSLEVLSKFINEQHEKAFKDYQQLIPNGFITFNRLWTLFPPNRVIISVVDGLQRAYRVSSGKLIENHPKDDTYFELTCWGWGYDDGYFGRFETKLKVSEFDKAQKILELEVYPLECLPEREQKELQNELVEGGRKWSQMITTSHKYYNGMAWQIEKSDGKEDTNVGWFSMFGRRSQWNSYTRTRTHVDGRIILDHDEFIKHNPGASISLVRGDPVFLNDTGAGMDVGAGDSKVDTFLKYPRNSQYIISDQQALVCSRTVMGYYLRDKVWADFIVDKVEKIEWDDSCFDKLQIEPDLKTILESLVSQYNTTYTCFKDILKGKSKGLTILLRGPPGSGKTLTAETISERSHKPLLSVASGELGTEAHVAEERLLKIFGLAQAWHAILLLDEADIFLARRTTKDIVRNAFVSVFLRNMEYYQGIMLLTTNRHEEFDEAFQSRIHIQIPYEPADSSRRTAIWKNLLDDQGTHHDLDAEAFVRIGQKYELNGRELKNLLSMSLAISRSKHIPLDEETIDKMFNLCHYTDL